MSSAGLNGGGVLLTTSNGGGVSDVIIQGNTFADHAREALITGGGESGLVFIGNEISNAGNAGLPMVQIGNSGRVLFIGSYTKFGAGATYSATWTGTSGYRSTNGGQLLGNSFDAALSGTTSGTF